MKIYLILVSIGAVILLISTIVGEWTVIGGTIIAFAGIIPFFLIVLFAMKMSKIDGIRK